MKISDFDKTHGVRVYRGSVNPRRAAPMLPRISDGSNDVDNASEILFTGGVVTEPEDGVAQVTLGGGMGGGGGTSAATAIPMLNNSGQDLNIGDSVVVDASADSAVTTSTSAGDIRIVGIVQEPIPGGAIGKVLFPGAYASLVNAPDAVRGEYAQISTTAKEAGSTTDREAGSFGVYLTGTDFPDFVTASATTVQEVPDTSLVITMPVSVPVDRILFLALWLDPSVTDDIDIPGWLRIGAESGYYYFYRISDGVDFAVATWGDSSVALACVLLLHSAVSLAIPIEDHDYDSTTSAATVGSLSDVARYAIAGVQADVTTPGSSFIRLAGGDATFLSGGTASLVQSASAYDTTVTLPAPPTGGNTLITFTSHHNATDTYAADSRDPGGCPEDTRQLHMARNVHGNGPGAGAVAMSLEGKTFGVDLHNGWAPNSACDAGEGYIVAMEFAGVVAEGFDVASLNDQTGGTVDLGTFTVGAQDVVVMGFIARDGGGGNSDPVVSPNGFTEILDAAGFVQWAWLGYKIGDGDASITLTSTTHQWGAAAVVLTGGGSSAVGTLAGKYIGHASSATSPFTGAPQQDDAIFAINLLQDAKPSALLYGPDLGASDPFSGDAADVNVADAGGYFTGTDVEAVLQELASKDIGYQAHGNMGSTETFSALTGWHSGTFNADCTFTFSGATSGLVASMVLELLEDGTGGWQPTWPGSVVWPGGTPPTHDDTLGTTTLYLFQSRDGGATWYGFQAGGGPSITFGTPAIVLGTAAAAGAIDEVIRRDATIVAFDATVPGAIGTAATGAVALAARRDHVHPTGAGTPSTQAVGDSAATGTGPAAAMSDHKHAMPAFGSPVAVGAANADGAATTLPRSDHVHQGSTGIADHAHIAYETHTSDGSTTTFSLDNYFDSGTVIAQNSTTGHNLQVTAETLPDQVTISAAGTAGDLLDFHYAAAVI